MAKKAAAAAEPVFIHCANCSTRVQVDTAKDTYCTNEKCKLKLVDHKTAFDQNAGAAEE